MNINEYKEFMNQIVAPLFGFSGYHFTAERSGIG